MRVVGVNAMYRVCRCTECFIPCRQESMLYRKDLEIEVYKEVTLSITPPGSNLLLSQTPHAVNIKYPRLVGTETSHIPYLVYFTPSHCGSHCSKMHLVYDVCASPRARPA